MIQFNPVFTKHLLSAVLSCITVCTHSLSVKRTSFRGKAIFVDSCFLCLQFLFCHFPIKYLMRVRIYNRCPLPPLICMHVVVAWVGGHCASWLNILIGHSSAVELQMRKKGGLAGMAASSICITCVSGGCSLAYRPSFFFFFLSSAASTKHPRIPQPELEDIMGSHTKDKAYLALTVSLREY